MYVGKVTLLRLACERIPRQQTVVRDQWPQLAPECERPGFKSSGWTWVTYLTLMSEDKIRELGNIVKMPPPPPLPLRPVHHH